MSRMSIARHVEPVGPGLLRLVALCAAAGLAACTTPLIGPASAPTVAQTSEPLSSAAQAEQDAARSVAGPLSKTAHLKIDHSERTQIGKASFYAQNFDGKKMANGRRFSSDENVAASNTLPLGTTVKVTDLDTGKSAVVKVEDRGPLVRGRVLDVSPKVADQLSMKKKGTAKVVVKPISVPQPSGE
jgi:rare lipoprotein A